MDLLWFVLCAYGLTQIAIYGKILDSVRTCLKEKSEWFAKLIVCPMCVGFWVGAFLFGINKYTELFSFEYNLANLLLLGWLSSGTSYVLCTVFGDEGIKHEQQHSIKWPELDDSSR